MNDAIQNPQHPLRVLHISTYDAMGGAARSTRRIHEGLLQVGVDSRMLVLHTSGQSQQIWQLQPSQHLFVRLRRRVLREIRQRQYQKYGATRRDPFQPFSDDRTDYSIDVRSFMPRPDVVNLYWVAGFVDYGQFFHRTPPNIPIIWRLSDMNPFTGGCHYAWDCEKWRAQCGACPELGSVQEEDLSRKIWERKWAVYRKRRIHIVAPSHWIAEEVRESSLLSGQPVTVIPNGLDTAVFAPQDKRQARKFFDLPEEQSIILTGAANLKDSRKGMKYLVEALRRLPGAVPAMLVTIGEDQEDDFRQVPLPYRNLGHITGDQTLATAYSTADFFIVPSIHENLPNTALEAMACGVPVIGFRTGGIPDIVRHGETGLLASQKDSVDLAAQISWLLDNPQACHVMGSKARKLVKSDYNLQKQAYCFKALYTSEVEIARNA